MKADLRISIKDYRRNKSLKVLPDEDFGLRWQSGAATVLLHVEVWSQVPALS